MIKRTACRLHWILNVNKLKKRTSNPKVVLSLIRAEYTCVIHIICAFGPYLGSGPGQAYNPSFQRNESAQLDRKPLAIMFRYTLISNYLYNYKYSCICTHIAEKPCPTFKYIYNIYKPSTS